MPFVIVRHRVEDYKRWKEGFEGAAAVRKEGGELSAKIFHLAGDENHILGLFEWSDLSEARMMFGGVEMRDLMRDAGVCEVPDFYYLEEAE